MAEKILLVEDEARIARTVRLYLEQAGYQVVTVDDGALALAAFRHERPGLVILDLMLPNTDGREICRQIRQISGVPIIMLTALSEETDRIVGLELGADEGMNALLDRHPAQEIPVTDPGCVRDLDRPSDV